MLDIDGNYSYNDFISSINLQSREIKIPPKKATHQKTKQHNRDLVLRTIFDHQPTSRAEIARITKLTRATVSDMVANLISEGLVEEVGYGESIGGKAPILLEIVADSRYLVGLNLAQDKFIGSVVNLSGEFKETIEFPVEGRDGERALKLVYKILDELTDNEWSPIVGIGIGTPGLINTDDGVVINAVNLDWQDLPLGQLLESRYDSPITILNDSQATAIGELVHGGDHEPEENLVVVTVKYGIGAGIVINGRLFQGDGGGAGEIGHVVIGEDGLLCRCGKTGCLETIASSRAVLQRAKTLAPEYSSSKLTNALQDITLESIKSAFIQNDPLARRIVTESGKAMGISLANLIGVLNIKKIVLTGDMTLYGEPWLQTIREAM
ncbi:MAG: ROK family transcriptional regulator [Chloroflexota bacterium]|nr:MAG: ROK family transcriptional regulator [Chloroflexota bacterium]